MRKRTRNVARADRIALEWIARTALALALACVWPAGVAHAFEATSVHRFDNPSGMPAGVIRRGGALYGVVRGRDFGQPNEEFCGIVFKLEKNGAEWTRLVLHRFDTNGGGCQPYGELVFGSDGALYGTTRTGGLDNCPQGALGTQCGLVFKLSAQPDPLPWTYSIIHRFSGGNQGFYPSAGLVWGLDGSRYGTTAGFCGSGGSTIYKLTPPEAGSTDWTHTVLRRGTYMFPPVAFGSDGALYGADTGCGSDRGWVFRLRACAIASESGMLPGPVVM